MWGVHQIIWTTVAKTKQPAYLQNNRKHPIRSGFPHYSQNTLQ